MERIAQAEKAAVAESGPGGRRCDRGDSASACPTPDAEQADGLIDAAIAELPKKLRHPQPSRASHSPVPSGRGSGEGAAPVMRGRDQT